VEFHVEADPDPLDVEYLEAQIRSEAAAATGLGDASELAIFVREDGRIIAGISGWTWGDSCELENLWVEPGSRGRWLGPELLAAAEAEAAARGCSQTVHFTYDFQSRRFYEWAGYELVGRVEDFPAGAEVRWYRKRLNTAAGPVKTVSSAGGSPGVEATETQVGSVDLSSQDEPG
jgi:GNAT superfamily N-acetyltransferase